MADLTTTDGLQLHFSPDAVTAVADHDADTLQAVTTVYGLMAGQVKVGEGAEEFLRRIGVAKSFAKFTRLDDTFIWINCTAVTVIRSPIPDEYSPLARAVVSVGSLTQAVKETLVHVKQMVNAHGGKL